MVNFVFLVIFGVVLNNGPSSSQVLQFGQCVDVETMRYFEVERFLGQWYEIERFPSWYENYGNCAYKRVQACGRQIEIEHAFVRDGVQYILHVNSTYIPGDVAVFNIEENNIDPIGVPFFVIATDYYNYAVAYGCKFNEYLGIKYSKFQIIITVSAWILSRNTTLEPELKELARLELNTLPHASMAYLEPVPQSEEDCEYLWTAHVRSNNNED